MNKNKNATIALLLLAAAANSQAGFFTSPTGLNSPGQVITFNEIPLAAGQPIGTAYSALGVTFGSMYYDTQSIVFGGVSSPAAENFSPVSPSFSIFFNTDQNRADFNMVTNDGEVTLFEAFLDGSLQASGSIPTGLGTTDFIGFSGVTFDEIRVTVSVNVNGAAAIDNLEFDSAAPVPEVGTTTAAAVFAVGALARAFRRRTA